MSVLLNVEDLKAWYGNTQVLFDVSLTVEEGQVISLMGRNGMGCLLYTSPSPRDRG